MSREGINKVVERLLADRRFTSRFRRDPKGALARYDVTAEEVLALKRGDQHELMSLGLDRRIVEPPQSGRPWLPSIVAGLAGKVGISVLIAAAIALAPVASEAAGPAKRAAGRRRATRRIARMSRIGPHGLRRAARRASGGRVATVKARVLTRQSYSNGVRVALSRVCDLETCSLDPPPESPPPHFEN